MYVTTLARTDGFGAQFQNIIFDILYAHAHKLTYVFPDIKTIDHNYTNDPTFVSKLIRFMNLKEIFPHPPPDVPIATLLNTTTYKDVESNLNAYISSEYFQMIQTLFLNGKQSPFDPKVHTIVAHVRRPNPRDDRTEGTNTSEEYYISRIKQAIAQVQDKPIRIVIHTQAPLLTLPTALFPHEVIVCYNSDPDTTFLDFVFADSLILSRSSYSYIAAFFCKGNVYYTHFWHPPYYMWII